MHNVQIACESVGQEPVAPAARLLAVVLIELVVVDLDFLLAET